MKKFFRAVMLIGGLSLLMLVGWLAVLRSDEATESNMIAFVSDRDNLHAGLYIMLADGSNIRQILATDDSTNWIAEPDWSPDGEWIAFSMTDSDTHIEHIYRMRVNGSDLQQLTSAQANNYGAAWSPDSQWIAYHDGDNVFVVRADGSEQRPLTQDGYNLFPAWSPDGERIVFVRGVLGQLETPSIHLVRPDGSGLRMIGSGEISEFSATFSPDGESIIFAREPGGAQVGGQAGYYRMRLSDRETSMLDDLFQMHVSISPVDWSASGEWAVYHDEQGLNREVARIRADGSGAEQLTNHEAEDLYPAWSPPMSLVWRGWVNALAGVAMLFVWMAVAARENFSRTG